MSLLLILLSLDAALLLGVFFMFLRIEKRLERLEHKRHTTRRARNKESSRHD
ncbi:MAG: hypothetical protein ACYCOU_08780 [Sulfobacillus sp.]